MRRQTTALLACSTLVVVMFIACFGQERGEKDPVIMPKGFSVELLDILVCPENLTTVRFARKSELAKVNEQIKKKALKRWGGALVKDPVEAMLIRKDNKVAYEVRDGIPVMLIEEALVLDESVCPPDPQKYRKSP